MATVIERDVSHDHGAVDSSATMIVAVVALIIVAGLAFFLFQNYYSNAAGTTNTPGLNVEVNGQVPTTPTTGAPY